MKPPPLVVAASPPAPEAMVALSGQRLQIDGRAGRIHVYVDSPAAAASPSPLPPLLLVHSINASASAAEMRPLYEHAQGSRPVYALDLPGYGLSLRNQRAYTPRLMTDALHDALDLIGQRHGADAPVDAVGLSLSCEYLVRAAIEAPQRLRRLVLVSPTGFSGNKRRYGATAAPLGPAWLPRLMKSAVGQGAFRLLTRPAVIRYFLQRTWGSKQIDEALWRYDLVTTRQPDAPWAPLDFLGAQLFSADINTLYEALEHPVLMVCGTRGDFADYRGQSTIEHRPNWQVRVMQDTGALMYFEQPLEFARILDEFLQSSRARLSNGLNP